MYEGTYVYLMIFDERSFIKTKMNMKMKAALRLKRSTIKRAFMHFYIKSFISLILNVALQAVKSHKCSSN